MARRTYELQLNGTTYKLRLTLRGQKNLKETDPEAPMMAIIMGAVDDPVAMDNLLTQALCWDGNENKIHTGEALYDEMVDAGMAGSEDMLKVIVGIAENAGILSREQAEKVTRVTRKMLNQEMELLDQQAQEGEEENPLKLQTLDS